MHNSKVKIEQDMRRCKHDLSYNLLEAVKQSKKLQTLSNSPEIDQIWEGRKLKITNLYEY